MKKALKYLLIITAGFFLLIMLFLLFTQTSMFRKIVKNKFTDIAASQWNMKIDIDEIDGNFYSNIELLGVSISKDDSTLVTFSSLKLDYNLLKLRNRQIVADTVLLENPLFNTWQNTDSTWNFIELFKGDESDTLSKNKPFNFTIIAKYIAIKNGSILSSSFIDIIPESLTGLNIEVDGIYSAKKIDANLHNLSFRTENPTLNIKKLSTRFTMEDKNIGVENFILRTSGSNINIDGKYNALDFLNANIEANPIDKQELAIFLPALKLTCSPQIKTELKVKNDTTNAHIELINNDQSIFADIQFHSLKKALKDKNIKAPYQANTSFKNVIPENWIERGNTNSIINGDVKVDGSHLLNYKLPIIVDGNFRNSVFQNRVFEKFLITGTFLYDRIEAEIDLQTENAIAKIDGNISNLYELPVYDVSVITDSLNLTSFFPQIDSTVLNANIFAHGEGFTNSARKIEATVQINNSTIYKIPVNLADIKISMDKQMITLDSLSLFLSGGSVYGSGNYNLATKNIFSDVRINADSLQFLDRIVTLPVNFKSINADVNIEGNPGDMVFSGTAQIKKAEGYSVQLDELETSYSVNLKKDSLDVKANFKVIRLNTEPIIWDTLYGEIGYFDNKIVASINAIWNDTLDAKIETQIQLGDTITAKIPVLDVKTFFSHYYLADTLQYVKLSDKTLGINRMWIKNYDQPDFDFKIDGNLSSNQTENIQFSIDNLDLKPFNKLIHLKDSISGVLSSNFTITGTNLTPVVKGDFKIENPTLGTIPLLSKKVEFFS